MNEYQVACKRNLERINQVKESGVVFSERRQMAYEYLREKVARFGKFVIVCHIEVLLTRFYSLFLRERT